MTNRNHLYSPKLSIITATFNAAKTLKAALDSVRNLTYNDFECLIVDGMSNDNTLSIVKCYEYEDSRFRHISEKDKGVYDAFNKGWKEARGQWIYYLGADDVLIPQGMEQLMSIAEKADDSIGMISGGVIRISQDGSQRVMITKGFIGSHQSMIVRKDVLDAMNGFDLYYTVLADFDLFIRLKNSSYNVINTDIVIAYFNAGGMSERIENTIKVFREKLRILYRDSHCKHPLLITLYDMSRTVLGGLYHKSKRCLNIKG